MDIKRTIGTKTVYKIQCYQAGFGYEPTWQTMDSATDYDDALIKYNEFINLRQTELKLRLISETVNIDVLEEIE